MLSERLIIFDYSGTLSLEAPRFSAPAELMRHLEETGLRHFGIRSPQIFWDRIVNPSWAAGSTTGAGYKRVMLDRIIAALQPQITLQQRGALADAVSAFVDRYLGHSRIDPRWRPVLNLVLNRTDVRAVIATDHYAEATGRIMQYLGEWQMDAATLAEAAMEAHPARFIVANSADLGVHKADPLFWQIVKTNLRLAGLDRLLIIDDFGFNEQLADGYADRDKVRRRMRRTVLTLQTVFQATIEVFPVMIGADEDAQTQQADRRIAEAAEAVARYLKSGPMQHGEP